MKWHDIMRGESETGFSFKCDKFVKVFLVVSMFGLALGFLTIVLFW